MGNTLDHDFSVSLSPRMSHTLSKIYHLTQGEHVTQAKKKTFVVLSHSFGGCLLLKHNSLS